MIAGAAGHRQMARPAGRAGRTLRFASLICCLIAGLCGIAPRPAFAQVPPGAITGGNEIENRRQLERIERQQQRPAQQGPSVVGPSRGPQDILKPGGPKFLLRHIEFDDSKFLTKEELEPLAAPLNGRKVDFSDLQKLIAAINELYAKKNIPTGIATLPPQDVKGGVVKIKLTEGRLEKMTVTGAVQTRPNYIMPRVQQTPGEVLDVPRLARDVTWFNRTSDPQIRALLQPGTSFGLTDVELATTEAPAHTLQFFTDNQGVKSTGRYQGGMYYKSAGALGFDDRFTFYGTTAQGNLNGSVSYNVPVNYWGGRLGVSYTQGAIRTVDGPFRTLDITGESQVGSVNFSQPVFVNDSWLVLVNAAQSLGKSDTWLSETKITDDRSKKTTAGVSVTQSGTDYSITVSPAFNYVDSHSDVTDLNRYFNVYSATANLLVRLPANFSFSATGSGQYTQERLLPGDQLFQIGGPTTIRGYPTNTVAGDSGYYINYELHNNLTNVVKGLDVYAFVDMGEVFSTFPARTALYSAGFGLSYTPQAWVTFEGSVGVPWKQVVADQIPGYQIYFRGVFRPLLLVL
jgi:hemolysin activation/secretion protein